MWITALRGIAMSTMMKVLPWKRSNIEVVKDGDVCGAW
jgi:hypothetical protein